MKRLLRPLILIVACCAHPQKITSPRPDTLIVWNVGQGLWVTLATMRQCLHFDMGGEFSDWDTLKRWCGRRENLAHFSHWDWDHIGFARRAAMRLNHFCVADYPSGPAPTRRKARMIGELRACNRSHQPRLTWRKTKKRINSNALSRVFLLHGEVLAPGDSTAKQERRWARRLKMPEEIRWLVLGHHGSRTSTSRELIAHLSRLKLAIASQRQARYGHPHGLVVARLRRAGVPVLTTEHWGHIVVPLSRSARSPVTEIPL